MTAHDASEPPPSLHRRTKDRMRAEAAAVAIELFLAHGFDATTVDDLCAATGLSRRSFFRYFKAKEDIVLAHLGGVAKQGCDAFTERPEHEDAWTALRHSMDPFTGDTADPDRTLALLRLVQSSPTLRAAHLDRLELWRASLATAIAHRAGRPAADLHASVLAAAALGAYTAAVRQWVDSNATMSLDSLLDQAFAVLEPAPDRPRDVKFS